MPEKNIKDVSGDIKKKEGLTPVPPVAPQASSSPQDENLTGKTRQPFRKTIVIVLLIALIGLNFAGSFLLKKEGERFSQLTQEFSLQQEFERANLTKDSSEQLADLNQAFLDEKGLINLISALNQAGSQFTTFSLNFESDEPVSGKGTKFLPLGLEVVGPPDRLKELLGKLINSPLALEITDLEVKRDLSANEYLKMTIKANLYVDDSFHQEL
jgi:Tfp pilus assembly protein PilO